MKKIIAIILITLIIPLVTFAAPVSVDRLNNNHIEPLIKTDFMKALYFLASSTSQASTFPYASTTALTVGSSFWITGQATGCATFITGLLTSTGVACGSGSGGGGGSWSTTTSQVSGRLINYSNNATDIVSVGGTSTSTANFYFDPNYPRSKFTGNEVHTGDYYHFGSNPTTDTYYCTEASPQCFIYVGNSNSILGSVMEVQNINSGSSAYGGFALANDNVDTLNGERYAGTFLTSSTYNDTQFGNGQNLPNQLQIANTFGGPITISNGCLTDSCYFNIISVGGGERFRVNSNGNTGIGTSTPGFPLVIYSPTDPQISLSAGANQPQWTMRNNGGVLNFATTTTGGNTLTSTNALSLNSTGAPFLALGTSSPVSSGNNIFSSQGSLYVGRKAGISVASSISTFDGSIVVNGTITNTGVSNGCASFSSGVLASLGVACGSGGGGGGSDVNWSFFNGSGLRPSTTTNQVLIGTTATTTLKKLEVIGGGFIDYASTTAMTVSGTSYLGTVGSGVLTGATGLPLTTGVTGTLPIANGGTNATSFTTTGNSVYWNGTSLLTAPLTSAVTTPYASTTAITAVTASSTNLIVSSAGGTAGCATFSVAGLISNTGVACGSGSGGSAYPFTPTANYGVTNQATTGIAWFQNGMNASSTSNFVNASTTALTVSGLSYLTGGVVTAYIQGTSATFGANIYPTSVSATTALTIQGNTGSGYTPRITMLGDGRTGFGTTTPNIYAPVSIASTSPGLVFTDTDGGLNAKHFGLFWNNGVFNWGTTTDSMTATSSSMTLTPGVPTAVSFATTTSTGILNLGSNPATTNASSTIFMNKLQWDGYDAGGTRRCTFINSSGALTTISGACNN